jgi:heme-degrading monooxygenase HmoA
MFARCVSIFLEADSIALFTRTINEEVIPLLRKQKGFIDEIVITVPGGTEVVGISLWDRKENLEHYSRDTFPQVQKTLANVIEGTPVVQIYEVTSSTFPKIAAHAAV